MVECLFRVGALLQDFLGGGVGTASTIVVGGFVGSTFVISSAMYVLAVHSIYIPMLQNMGYTVPRLPKILSGPMSHFPGSARRRA